MLSNKASHLSLLDDNCIFFYNYTHVLCPIIRKIAILKINIYKTLTCLR